MPGLLVLHGANRVAHHVATVAIVGRLMVRLLLVMIQHLLVVSHHISHI